MLSLPLVLGLLAVAAGQDGGSSTVLPPDLADLTDVFNPSGDSDSSTTSAATTSTATLDPAPANTLNTTDVCMTFGGPTCAATSNLPGLLQPCSCPDGSPGRCECVVFYQCDSKSGKYDTDGKATIDLRKNDSCPDVVLRCCKIDIADDAKERPSRHKEYPEPKPPQAMPCGSRNDGGVSSKIINAIDGEAGFGEFPWMVAVLMERPGQPTEFKCGGALIGASVVLTAAHCVKSLQARLIRARLGEWDRESESELYKHQDRAVSQVIIHHSYYGGNYKYDAALLVLDSPTQLGYHVGTVCLPERDHSFEGQKCVVTGWGKEKLSENFPHRFLKKLDLPIVPRAQCEAMLRSTPQLSNFKLHESFICAGGERNRDACKGDGGGPLVCSFASDRLRYYLAGIVAWGVDCGAAGVPGLYANVALLRPWIDEQLEKLGIEAAS